MQTMEPVIKHGLSTWNRAVLPPDEFESRQAQLNDLMKSANFAAVVGFENSTNPGLVGYETNFRTAAGLTTLICAPDQESTLLAGLGGTRDHPSIRAMSFTQDLQWFPEVGPGIATVLSERGITSGRAAVAGMYDCLSHDEVMAVVTALKDFEVVTFDDELNTLRRAKRSREIAVLRLATAILSDARHTGLEVIGAGGSVHAAITASERVARLRGCRDFRAVALADDGSLRPWPICGNGAQWSEEPVAVYLAGEYLGYWSDAALVSRVTLNGDSLGERALVCVKSALRAGTSIASLRQSLEIQLGEEAAAVSLRITGIGLGLEEAPFLTDDTTDSTRSGDVLSVQVWATQGTRVSLEVDHVIVEDAGCRALNPGVAS
jgi:hypothetical protein